MAIHPNLKIVRSRGLKNTMKKPFKLEIKGTDLKWTCPNENQGEVLLNESKLIFFYGRNVFFYKGKKYKGSRTQCEEFIKKRWSYE